MRAFCTHDSASASDHHIRSPRLQVDGRVNDHLDTSTHPFHLDNRTFTYNFGTFIGAATMLFDATGNARYLHDAALTVAYAQANLTGAHVAGVLNDEGTDGDGVGFKGIFVRWAARYARHANVRDAQVLHWLRFNAASCWQQHNQLNISWTQWWHPTPPYGVDPIASFDASSCASAVVNTALD